MDINTLADEVMARTYNKIIGRKILSISTNDDGSIIINLDNNSELLISDERCSVQFIEHIGVKQ
jgi:hypothetical protein